MSVEWSDGIVLAELADEPTLSDDLNAMIERLESMGARAAGSSPADTPHIVLNFQNVTYVNSSNLAQLLRLRKLMEALGRQLRLCSVRPDVYAVVRITGLDKIFHIAPDPLTALAAIQIDDAQ